MKKSIADLFSEMYGEKFEADEFEEDAVGRLKEKMETLGN
jgi:hypothetical protein